jgi:tetratricopeptide (TPR) repeat protein
MNHQPSANGLRTVLGVACAIVLLGPSGMATTHPAQGFYNEGVNKLAGKELREAETAFRRAVETNYESVQPAALYNLGHVRFLQGKETLKGEGNRQQLLESSDAATAFAEEVIRHATPIAERDDVNELIGAYMEARAARKRLRLTKEENTREMDLLGSALSRWRRSVGDFRSAHELNQQNADASFNADVVERHIEELLKFKKKLEEEQEDVGQQREKLKELMKKMRGKIPKEMQRGSDEEEDDEEDEQQEPPPEGETAKQQQQRIGGDREIDPDMLRVLKEKMPQRTMSVGQEGEREMQGFRPGGQKPGEPKARKGRDW